MYVKLLVYTVCILNLFVDSCPKDSIELSGFCYTITKAENYNFTTAMTTCMSDGGELAVLQGMDKLAAVVLKAMKV